MEVPMPPLPKPADLETIAYAEGDRVCIDVVLDHVVVQTVTLSLAQLREYRELIAERASRRPAVQIDPATFPTTADAHYWPSRED
jgi:hypothetical protein